METIPSKPSVNPNQFKPSPIGSGSKPGIGKSDEPKARKKKVHVGNFPRASVKRLIVASGLRTQPNVVTKAEEYLTKVLKDVADECKKLAIEDKRSTIYEKDIDKVLKFKPFCDI
jgi:histone H3/H4